MSKISFSGSSTGTATFDIVAPATNTNRTITLPDSSGQVSVLDLRTTVTASGTSVDFLNIPSTARRITVMFNGVSTSGASSPQIQIGAGSVDTSGYSSAGSVSSTATGGNFTTGFGVLSDNASAILSGHCVLTSAGSNLWVCSMVLGNSGNNITHTSGGVRQLSGTLDRIRITTVNGTDTFDAGSINILVE